MVGPSGSAICVRGTVVDTESKMTPEDKQLIDDYLADMEFRELSPVTIKQASYNITKYAREVGLKSDNVIQLRHDLQRWLMRDSLQPQTRALWLTAIHGFYKWANAEGHFRRVEAPNGALEDFDPTLRLARPKSKKGTPHPIPEDDLSKALEFADARMKCWLLIAAECGARCKEVAGIRREDVQEGVPCGGCSGLGYTIDDHDERVTCKGCDGLGTMTNLHLEFTKGSKPRDVPMEADVLSALYKYGMPESGPLWDVNAEDVSRQGNAFLHDLGIKSTMHKLRHRAGTVVYRATDGDSFLTADFLGHSDPSITRTYAAPDSSKVTAILGKLRVKGNA